MVEASSNLARNFGLFMESVTGVKFLSEDLDLCVFRVWEFLYVYVFSSLPMLSDVLKVFGCRASGLQRLGLSGMTIRV